MIHLSITLGLTFCAIGASETTIEPQDLYKNDLVHLFNKTPDQINLMTALYVKKANDALALIINLKKEERSFSNTVQSLDRLLALSDVAIHSHVIGILKSVSPSEAIRKVAQENLIQVKQFFIEHIFNNPELYRALKEYNEGNKKNEILNREQQYFLQDSIKQFECNGLSLPESIQLEIKDLKKQLAVLETNFESNVANDKKSIVVKYTDLQGLEIDFINQLERSKDGGYILGVDYPTYFNVMDNCSIESTRKNLFLAFENRAYPANEKVLMSMIKKRDRLAKALGYTCFAELDFCNQMVGSVNRVEKFLNDLEPQILAKEKQEFDTLIAHLPNGVTLTVNGKLKPWDFAYVRAQYRKKFMQLDENMVAEYFSMNSTIEGLLKIYEQFFNLRFKEINSAGFWHEDVKLVQVFDGKDQLLGHIFLDLHPRPNKFTHACCIGISPVVIENEHIVPGATLVITNFPKGTSHKPALLKRTDVRTFFHEFGHALHWILGKTSLYSMDVKTDFVELPSQMLEEWLFDASILKNLSKHYKTGQQLPDETIEKIIALKTFDSGATLQRLLFLSHISLEYFKSGDKKNPDKIFRQLSQKLRPNMAPADDAHFFTAFVHLPDYAAKYYGYLWSKVFALDIFATIKKHGLLDPVIGQKYVDDILSKGGCEDPNILLNTFLGRDPNQEAFLHDMGLIAK